jgi:hypothetical protein
MKYFHLILKNFTIMIILTFPAFGQNLQIFCPYIGTITDVYKDDKLDLKDNSLLKGIFFQWVDPDHYQWNAFIYNSSNINYSTIWGGHFIFDYYIPAGDQSKFVVGSGIEYLRIKMDADSNFYGIKNFEMTNNVYIPYVRGGYRMEFNSRNFKTAVLPWAGIEYEAVKGNVQISVDPPGPAPLVTTKADINDCKFFAMAGLNLNAMFFHAFEVELKYYGAFDKNNYYSTANAMVNIFFTRHCGLSYRAKYMEIDKGSDLYHIFGLAFVF